MCENGPRSVRRVCVYVSACVSGSILSLYFIPKPSPSSVALPLLPAPIFAGRASGPKNGFQTDPTISLSLSRTDCLTSICPRCVSVCAYFSFFTILSSFFLFVFFPFFSYSSFIFSFVFAFIWRRCGWVMGAGFLPSPISPSHQTVHTRPHRKFKNKFKSFFSRMYKKIDI